MVQHLTPAPYAAIKGLTGYDPFKQKEIPTGAQSTFFSFGLTNTPIWNEITKLNMSAEERKAYQSRALNPRSKGQEVARMFGSSLAPAPYNIESGQGLAMKSASTEKQRAARLEKDAASVNIYKPTPEILAELHTITQLDKKIHKGQSPSERYRIAAALYDKLHGTHLSDIKHATEGDANDDYLKIRHYLAPNYEEYKRRVDERVNKQARAKVPS